MRRALGGLIALIAVLCPQAALGAEQEFDHLPWPQYWTAPPHVFSARFDVFGAQGAGSIYFPEKRGGLGGRATATIEVVPGRRYTILVGGAGRIPGDPTQLTSEGGGGSEVRMDSTRLIAAGGGGGGSYADGGPGGAEQATQGGIDGQGSPFAGGPGAGGVSWGPPGTAYESGVRSGDGLVTVSYDPLPQNTLIESGPRRLTNDDTPTFSFASTEAGVAFHCFDEFTFGTCSGPGGTHTTEPLSDGLHSFAVTSSDSAGFSDPTPATRRFAVDTRPPVVRITRRPDETVETDRKRVSVHAGFTSAEAKTTFECRLDSRRYRRCESPWSVRVKAGPGRGARHSIDIRGTDPAGNTGDPASAGFRALSLSARAGSG